MGYKRSDIIFLVGYRATGKTTLGIQIANILGWKFVDLDKEIEKRMSKSIKDIFSEFGESKFRDIESEVLKSVFDVMSKIVVSTGGGCVIREENREILKKGIVVLLKSNVETIVARMLKDNSRPPLMEGVSLEYEVKHTLAMREKFYDEVWDILVVNEDVSPDVVSRLLANCLGK